MSNINNFLKDFDKNINSVEQLALSGSGRVNYKISTDKNEYILTENENVLENNAFFYLSNLLKNLNGNVPDILKISTDKKYYIQSLVGDETLLQKKLNGENVTDLYNKTVKLLAKLQIATASVVDETKLFESTKFDSLLVYRDLFYFKNYFLDFTPIQYSQAGLLDDFKRIANHIEQSNYVYFIFRDFQGRNIMIKDQTPYFIDYQDGMFGPIAYDLVSLLWQAKAELSTEEKEIYFDTYINQVKNLIPNQFDLTKFKSDYNNCLIMRLLQVLGAYGKLGIIQKKTHFQESINYGIRNLKSINNDAFMKEYPTLQYIIEQLNEDSIKNI